MLQALPGGSADDAVGQIACNARTQARRRAPARDRFGHQPPRHARRHLHAAVLACRPPQPGFAGRTGQADPHHGRGLRALPRRVRQCADHRLPLPAPRRADASRLGRGRRHPLRLSRLEVRLLRSMRRAAGRGSRLCPQGADRHLSDARISRPDLRLFRRRRAAAVPAFSPPHHRGPDPGLERRARALQLSAELREQHGRGACRLRPHAGRLARQALGRPADHHRGRDRLGHAALRHAQDPARSARPCTTRRT